MHHFVPLVDINPDFQDLQTHSDELHVNQQFKITDRDQITDRDAYTSPHCL